MSILRFLTSAAFCVSCAGAATSTWAAPAATSSPAATADRAAADASIDPNLDDQPAIDALLNRASARKQIDAFDDALTDLKAARRHAQNLPEGKVRELQEIRIDALEGETHFLRNDYDEAIKAYEAAWRSPHFERLREAPVYAYNLMRAYAHEDVPYQACQVANQLLPTVQDKTDDRSRQVRRLTLRQRAILNYLLGDLDAAKQDWQAAIDAGIQLGKPPFDADQAPLNKAVQNGRDKERLARARYLLKQAEIIQGIFEIARGAGATDESIATFTGGTMSIIDTQSACATPVTLADDAIHDVEMAIHRDIGDTWGPWVFDVALVRAQARGARLRYDRKTSPFTLAEVDATFNHVIEVDELNLDGHAARAKWIAYRLKNWNDVAREMNVPMDVRETSRAGMRATINDDLSRVLQRLPDDAAAHVARARIAVEQPAASRANRTLVGAPDEVEANFVDTVALAYDLDAALAPNADDEELDDDDRKWATQARDALHAKLASQPKPPGTALGWKEHGNAASAKKAYLEAFIDYTNAIRVDPNFADAYNNRSGVYRQWNQWDLAERDLSDAIRLDPTHRAAWLNRATLRGMLGEWTDAIADARKAVEVAPSDAVRYDATKVLVDQLTASGRARADDPKLVEVAFNHLHEANVLAGKANLPADSERVRDEGIVAALANKGRESLTALRAAHAAKPDDVPTTAWLIPVACALNEPDVESLAQAALDHGDRASIEQVDDVFIKLMNRPPLTSDGEAEMVRLKALHHRFYTAYRAK